MTLSNTEALPAARAVLALSLAGAVLLAASGCTARVEEEYAPVPVDTAVVLRVKGEESWISLGFYDAKEPQSLAELPTDVQDTVRKYMTDRLGPGYYAKLSFVGGQVVDTAAMYRRDPDTRKFRWPLFGYRLGFRLAVPDSGVDSYVGYLTLDVAGRLQSQLEFPAVRADTSKAGIISVSAARAIAAQEGLTPTRVEMEYRAELNSLVYKFSEYVLIRPNYGGGKIRFVEIDAHSGRVVQSYVVEFRA